MTRVALLAFVLTIPACSPVPSGVDTAAPVAATAPAGASAADDAPSTVSGVVAETMNSGGYTYARLSGAHGDTWMAAAEFAVLPGATILAAVDMPMSNFRSRTLNREFAEIYFVRDVVMNGAPVVDAATSSERPAMAGSHEPDPGGSAARPPALIAPVRRGPGGQTVADLWARRAALSGQPVVVRGRIVKVNLGIMGVNWYHVQDGSGEVADGTHDVVVTSTDERRLGEVVTVEGVLATGKDFGAGYTYEAIIEGADLRTGGGSLRSLRR